MADSKKRKYSTAFDPVVEPINVEKCTIEFIPNRVNIFYEPDSSLLYVHFVLPKKFDVIKNINIDIANKFEILFNDKKFDYDPSMDLLMFASYMTCIRLRIYFDNSKRDSSFNITFDGYMLDSSVKDPTKEYFSSGFSYKRGVVKVKETEPITEFKF